MLLITMHHIIADAWSAQVLFRELQQLYYIETRTAAAMACIAAAIQGLCCFATSLQMKRQSLEEHRRYWLRQFDGPLPVRGFPADLGVEASWQEGHAWSCCWGRPVQRG